MTLTIVLITLVAVTTVATEEQYSVSCVFNSVGMIMFGRAEWHSYGDYCHCYKNGTLLTAIAVITIVVITSSIAIITLCRKVCYTNYWGRYFV